MCEVLVGKQRTATVTIITGGVLWDLKSEV